MRLELSPDDAEVIAQMIVRHIDRWPALVRSALIFDVAHEANVFDAACNPASRLGAPRQNAIRQ